VTKNPHLKKLLGESEHDEVHRYADAMQQTPQNGREAYPDQPELASAFDRLHLQDKSLDELRDMVANQALNGFELEVVNNEIEFLSGLSENLEDQQNMPARPKDETQDDTPIKPKSNKAASFGNVNVELAPSVRELIGLWKRGEHMAVAARLMFTPASYVDFIALSFTIGQAGAMELAGLLDELSDTENMRPPSTPPEYKELLQKVAGANAEENVI
jgi:hypothetical protein